MVLCHEYGMKLEVHTLENLGQISFLPISSPCWSLHHARKQFSLSTPIVHIKYNLNENPELYSTNTVIQYASLSKV